MDSLKKFSKYIILFIFITISLIGIFILIKTHTNINTPENVETQQILIFDISLDNWGILLTILGIPSTAIFTLFQYYKSKRLKQQQRASEIADDFADNLIEKMGLISDTLMQSSSIQKMVARVAKSKKLNSFTTVEIISILNDEKCFEKFESIVRSKETQQIYKDFLKQRYNEKEQERFESYFPLLVENTLNHLEAKCINISSKAAGSQFIYNSLHQSFLYTIEVLAIKMSKNNNNNVDKYYTHIIEVYNMWNTQKQKDINRFNKTNKKISKLYSKVDKTVDKLLNKKNGTV